MSRYAAAAILFSLAAHALAQTYVVEDIPALPGQTYSFPTGINKDGDVVGYAQRILPDGTSVIRGFYFSNGQTTEIPPVAGDQHSEAKAINDAGVIAAASWGTDPLVFHAFLVHRGVIELLPAPPIGSPYPRAINKRGDVAGSLVLPSGYSHAFVYSRGTYRDLGTLGGADSSAFGLNSRGTTVGSSSLAPSGPDYGYRAFKFDRSMMNLGTFADAEFSQAFGINNGGQIVGQSSLGRTSSASHAFLLANQAMRDLGTLGGPNSTAYAVNDAGDVIGNASLEPSIYHAFVLFAGSSVMLDLNDLTLFSSSSTLTDARGINVKGDIAVLSRAQTGETRAAVLHRVQ